MNVDQVFAALADPTRCRILVALLDGVSYPGQLATQLGLTRSNVSNHLSCLRGCGLVLATYEGRQVRYALADAHRRPWSQVQPVLVAEGAAELVDWHEARSRVAGLATRSANAVRTSSAGWSASSRARPSATTVALVTTASVGMASWARESVHVG